MPAINPARLKQQAAVLAEQFNNPQAFIRSLHHLLDSYAERIQPTELGKELPSISPTYRVRRPVLRQILLELAPLAKDDSESGLVLCDALWDQIYLEPRLLAASLLGQIPCDPAEPVLARFQNWIKPGLEERLLEALLTQGIICLRKRNQTVLIRFIQSWLNSPEWFQKKFGLRLLLSLANDPEFENLPVLYRSIQSLTRSCPVRLRPDLLDALAALAQRSPSETAYFFRQTLGLPESPDTPLLLRQSLQEFPPEFQESLRILSREYYSTPSKK